MASFHNEPFRGHSGVKACLKKLGSMLYWKGMSKDMKYFVKSYDIFQRNKPNLEAYPRPLQPLPIPTQ
ncbi:retrotransposon-related protein, partial [Tanacetum coccineum]